MNAMRALVWLSFKEIFRRKDFYAVLVILAALFLWLGQMPVYHDIRTVRPQKEAALLLIYLASAYLAASLASRQLESETQSRTLQVILAKPVSRLEWLLGKWLGVWAAGAAGFFILMLFFAAFTLPGAPASEAAAFLQGTAAFVLALGVLCAAAIGLSFFLSRDADLWVVMLLYLGMTVYGDRRELWTAGQAGVRRMIGAVLYQVLPHLEFFDLRQRMIHGGGPADGRLLVFLTAYAAAYAAAFLALGWLAFRKKPL